MADKKKTTAKTDVSAAVRAVNVDRVAMPSLNKDGSIDQTDDYQLVGDKDVIEAGMVERQKQFNVSAVDQQLRGVTSEPGVLAGDSDEGTTGKQVQDPKIQKLIDAGEAAEAEAEPEVKAEVEAHYVENPNDAL